jgi:hypothetical protein
MLETWRGTLLLSIVVSQQTNTRSTYLLSLLQQRTCTRLIRPLLGEYKNRAASVRKSDPGASTGHIRNPRMGIKSNFSHPIQSQGANAASRCVQQSNISRHPPSSFMLRPCCDPCCVQHHIRSFRSLPPQHKNRHHMSGTSKLNIRNIKI